jgi:hypothetical protein
MCGRRGGGSTRRRVLRGLLRVSRALQNFTGDHYLAVEMARCSSGSIGPSSSVVSWAAACWQLLSSQDAGVDVSRSRSSLPRCGSNVADHRVWLVPSRNAC